MHLAEQARAHQAEQRRERAAVRLRPEGESRARLASSGDCPVSDSHGTVALFSSASSERKIVNATFEPSSLGMPVNAPTCAAR